MPLVLTSFGEKRDCMSWVLRDSSKSDSWSSWPSRHISTSCRKGLWEARGQCPKDLPPGGFSMPLLLLTLLGWLWLGGGLDTGPSAVVASSSVGLEFPEYAPKFTDSSTCPESVNEKHDLKYKLWESAYTSTTYHIKFTKSLDLFYNTKKKCINTYLQLWAHDPEL